MGPSQEATTPRTHWRALLPHRARQSRQHIPLCGGSTLHPRITYQGWCHLLEHAELPIATINRGASFPAADPRTSNWAQASMPPGHNWASGRPPASYAGQRQRRTHCFQRLLDQARAHRGPPRRSAADLGRHRQTWHDAILPSTGWSCVDPGIPPDWSP